MDHVPPVNFCRNNRAGQSFFGSSGRLQSTDRIPVPRFQFLLAVLLCAPLTAQERTLSWRSLDVDAKLDREGELHVSERHRMVFTGAWNGGERIFHTGQAQGPDGLSISRIDPSGQLRPLVQAGGQGIGLHQYRFDGITLRWRARGASDPPFRGDELTWVIDYTLRNVVARKGGGYEIDHDFAFADRPGVIEKYSLNLELDPAWQPAPDFTPRIERLNLPPGQSVILNLPLSWAGEGEPRHVAAASERQPAASEAPSAAPAAPALGPPPLVNLISFLLFAGLAYLMCRWFEGNEEVAGRYKPQPAVTPEWLEKNLLNQRAEVVGAAWDSKTGEAEVAALIATMTMEGKIENVAGSNPRLKLLLPVESLSQYERDFVKCLFVRGDEIDPATLRRHYASTGFDPAAAIRPWLQRDARQLVGSSGFAASIGLGCLGLLIVFHVLPLAGAASGQTAMAILGIIGTPVFLVTLVLASRYRSKPSRRSAVLLPVPLVLFAAALSVVAASAVSLVVSLVVTLFLLGSVIFSARWPGSARELETLRNFRAARDDLKRRLERGEADFDERWVPYLLAFGLGTELDRWFVAAPRSESGSSTDRPRTSFRPATMHDPAQSGPVFRGGGGAFGGGGASGGWASSIRSFAAAVPPPAPAGSSGSGSRSWSSSSSSSSARSGGGSRSGGGGGGGW